MRYTHTVPLARAALLACVLVLLPLARADAQSSVVAESATETAIAELRAAVLQQGAIVERQSRMLEAQAREIDALRRRISEITPSPPPPSETPTATGAWAPASAAAAPATGNQGPQRIPEMPAAIVSAGDFPGSIAIPGTEAAFKIGGQARMLLVHSFGPLGTDDRFVTSSIPVEGDQVAGEARRTNYSASPSRLNLDLRSRSPLGPVRTFMEADFAGSGNTMRLRHAFIQTPRRWMVGQTWSTFSDPEAEPLGIDFEGLNAISLFRQPQVRYTHSLRPSLDLALALEDPSPDLTGAQGVNLTPDAIVRLRWEPERSLVPHLLSRTAHVQAALLVRQLRGEPIDQPETTLSTGGVGGNISGVLVPRWDSDDRLKFASNFGWGIGRYITDLGTLGGQDAIYDPGLNQLRALSVSSGYVGYERVWRPTFTSAITYGIVNVANLDIQPDDALRRTQRATINLTWTPTSQVDVVLEFLGGTRVNKDGRRGSSSQLQAGWTFRF